MEEEFIAIISLLLLQEEDYREKQKDTRIHLRQLRDSSNPFEQSTADFKRNFRVNKETAQFIINQLRPHYNETSNIPFELKVLATLHFYGHGSYQKSIGSNSIIALSQASVSRSISTISKMIETHLFRDFVKFPLAQWEKQKNSERFLLKFGMKDVIGCIDGCHIAIISPPLHDLVRPAHLYMNRKGFYSINVEMIVDADLRYLFVNPKFPGSVQDSEMWITSSARVHLADTYTKRCPHILLGNSDYPLEPWLFTPFDSGTTNQAEVLYNQLHETTRNVVEQAIGATKSRFRCLLKHRTLHYYPTMAATIINAVCTVYNLCVSLNDTADVFEFDEEEDTFDISVNPGIQNVCMEGKQLRNAYAANLLVDHAR